MSARTGRSERANSSRLVLLWLMNAHFLWTAAQQSHIKDFNGLGYVLSQIDTINVYNVQAQLTFVITLPEQVMFMKSNFNCTAAKRTANCTAIQPMVNELYKMREFTLEQLQKHIHPIYTMIDALESETRQERADGWVQNWMSHALSVTGLAETNDIETIKQSIQKLESMLVSSSETSAVSQTII